VAYACSCFCTFEHSVSEYLENYHAFWGVPKQSILSSEYLVRSEVEVLEGYKRLQVGDMLTIDSKPDDGGSCGIQLNTGVPQFIVAYKGDENNTVSTCSCEPPFEYILKYLNEGEDTYMPNPDDCWHEDGKIKSNKKCKVWRDVTDDYTAQLRERRRMYKKLRTRSLKK
jgi:hypothetical protein